MRYEDPIYGPFEIEEAVLCELIGSPTMQRLKGVDQGGFSPPGSAKGRISRFEHSLGVFCLLRMHRAALLEQIAGLLHDVSHAVFSHCVDYALDEGSPALQSHQDNIHEAFLEASEVNGILSRYGIALSEILDDSRFPLKERPLPDLCADRIDYSLRTALEYGEKSPAELRRLITPLAAWNNLWVFSTRESAREYAELFDHLNRTYWCGAPTAKMFHAVGECLRHALKQGVLTRDDLYTTDAAVLSRLENAAANDAALARLYRVMQDRRLLVEDKDVFSARVVCKSRIVDPLFMSGRAIPLSSADPDWGEVVTRELKPKEYWLRTAN